MAQVDDFSISRRRRALNAHAADASHTHSKSGGHDPKSAQSNSNGIVNSPPATLPSTTTPNRAVGDGAGAEPSAAVSSAQKPRRDGAATGNVLSGFSWAVYVLINLVSCCGLGLYFAGVISPMTEILFVEVPLTVFKLGVEVATEEFTLDLALHHLCFFGCVLAVTATSASTYTWLLVQMHVVHLPLMLANLKRMLSAWGAAYAPAKRQVEKVFLITWAMAASYRCLTISSVAYDTIRDGDWVSAVPIVPSAVAFIFLDYYWTPFRKYAKLFAPNKEHGATA